MWGHIAEPTRAPAPSFRSCRCMVSQSPDVAEGAVQPWGERQIFPVQPVRMLKGDVVLMTPRYSSSFRFLHRVLLSLRQAQPAPSMDHTIEGSSYCGTYGVGQDV